MKTVYNPNVTVTATDIQNVPKEIIQRVRKRKEKKSAFFSFALCSFEIQLRPLLGCNRNEGGFFVFTSLNIKEDG